ncbi:hypothetical protein Q6265_30380, partial [Klebsiella pneumoniae]|nr:hypothetical protein [Klebsiella pneumoniae]
VETLQRLRAAKPQGGIGLLTVKLVFTHSSHAAIRLYGREYVNVPHKQAYFTAPVEIGRYCFIGAHATLLPGTRLGKGSV